nr:glycosyltransferase N-terminal domain-containing protein [Limimaricola pyoseonensis]
MVWVHCPDPARSGAVVALDRRLADEGEPVRLLLTGPRPAGETGRLLHAPAPPDSRLAAQEFLARWQPDMLIWMQGALQPALLAEAARAGLPAVLADAQAETATLSGGGWRPGARRLAFQRFERLLAVDGTAAARLRRLGVEDGRIEITGALDEDHPLPGYHESDRADMAQAIGARPVWLVAGATGREIDAVSAAHRQASRRAHRLLMILAPAEAREAEALAAQLRRAGLQVAERLTGEEPDEATEAYVADGPDELGLWYRLAPMTLMGGTLEGGPCRTPFEPAALGSAVIHGARFDHHRRAYERLAVAGACRRVRNAQELGFAVETLLSPDRAAGLARAAWDVSTEGAEASNRVIDLIRDTLERRG